MESPTPYHKPTIHELGTDLLNLSGFRLFITVVLPFVFFALYFVFAFHDLWIPAVICTVALSFFTYGSTSHDLVHQNLKINKSLNTILLSAVELICFRSGHAYKLSHLYHHKRYPHDDDIEGAASRMTFFRSLLEGIVFQFKIYAWSLKHGKDRPEYGWIVTEGIVIILLISGCIYSLTITPIFFVYFCLMIMGSWIIPLVTSYAVHTPSGEHELTQTRLFRGKFFSFIAFDHLYHLEHHMYPMVPHKNWPLLAQRLDPFFKSQKIRSLNLNEHSDGQENLA